jgi:integrase
MALNRPISGHVFRIDRKRGAVWYAKYRLPDGRQVQKKLGPAWTERGRPPVGYFTKRTAQTWLDETLATARRGELAGMVRTETTFSEAAEEWLRYVEHERACKPSTVADYRKMTRVLAETFGPELIESVTPESIERWKATITQKRKVSNRTLQKYLVTLHGIFKRATRIYGLPRNPVATVERPRLPRRAGIDVLSREEVSALVRAAESEEDGALYLTAAFTGLRLGELLALRWKDVDFEVDTIRVERNYTAGHEGTPKSGRGRAVPMMEEVAETLARQGQRERFVGDQDLVFCDRLGRHLAYKSLSARYRKALERARLRPLRFHDLRHTFGTHAIRHADPREVMEWMGHADLATTQKYLAYKPRGDAARRLSEAFRADTSHAVASHRRSGLRDASSQLAPGGATTVAAGSRRTSSAPSSRPD